MALFVKGQKRPENAGRKKGSLNKKTVMKVADYLADNDINPAQEAVNAIKYMTDDKAKFDAWIDLIAYCEAKPKAVEVNETDAITESDENILEKYKDVSTEHLALIYNINKKSRE